MKKTFTGNTRLFLCISGAIIVIALVMQIAGVGLNLGIDFTGGSILNYSVGEDYDVNDVETLLKASGYNDSQITKAPLGELNFPQDAIIGGIIRGNESLIADGDTRIKPYDRVVIFALPSALARIEKFFA